MARAWRALQPAVPSERSLCLRVPFLRCCSRLLDSALGLLGCCLQPLAATLWVMSRRYDTDAKVGAGAWPPSLCGYNTGANTQDIDRGLRSSRSLLTVDEKKGAA